MAAQLLGGDLMLSVAQREASADERAAIDALGRSSKSVTTRAMLVTTDGRSLLAELSGVDANWRLAGAVSFGPGGRRPAGAEVAIGHEIAERLDLQPGDQVRIGNASYRISGDHRTNRPGPSGFALAPPAIMDEAGLAMSGLIQPGSLYSTQLSAAPAGREPTPKRPARPSSNAFPKAAGARPAATRPGPARAASSTGWARCCCWSRCRRWRSAGSACRARPPPSPPRAARPSPS